MAKKIKKKHPLFILKDFLNDFYRKIPLPETRTLKERIKSYMNEFYDKVFIFDDKYIVCQGTKTLTKEVCIIYVRKNIDLQEVIGFSKKTRHFTEKKNYCKIIVLKDITERMEGMLFTSFYIDYIKFCYEPEHKRWEDSFSINKKFRKLKVKK